jgi:hypothetical protein
MGTTERLRDDIDRGRRGDKVPFPDPAAAPLGTDDEAAGTSPEPARIARARADELGRTPGGTVAVTHEDARGYSGEAADRVPREEAPGRPRRRGADRRALFMLVGAAVVMGVALTVWAALMS